MKAWIYRALGNIAYILNDRLSGLHKNNRRDNLVFWAWLKHGTQKQKRQSEKASCPPHNKQGVLV